MFPLTTFLLLPFSSGIVGLLCGRSNRRRPVILKLEVRVGRNGIHRALDPVLKPYITRPVWQDVLADDQLFDGDLRPPDILATGRTRHE